MCHIIITSFVVRSRLREFQRNARYYFVTSIFGDGQRNIPPIFGSPNNFAGHSANNANKLNWVKSVACSKYSIRYSWSESSDCCNYENAWNTRYEELLQYKKEHGNTLVPHVYEENPRLGYWVDTQRSWYKANKLNPERVEKLDAIGFVWDVKEMQWLEQYEELIKHKKDHGDALVPIHYEQNPSLGIWVMTQRKDYKRYMAKKKLNEDEALQHEMDASEVEKIMSAWTGMTEKRIRLLEAVGFVWNSQNHAWQIKFEELCEWIKINGHGAVRSKSKSYDPLGGWVDRQREMYRRYLKGEKIGLPVETIEERIEKLKRVGFVFGVEMATAKTESTKGNL